MKIYNSGEDCYRFAMKKLRETDESFNRFYNRFLNYLCSGEWDDSTYIYFIQDINSGLIKIGYAANKRQRIQRLRNINGGPLRVLAFIDGSLCDEDELHKIFKMSRHHGEWFFPSRELLDLIDGYEDNILGEELDLWNTWIKNE